MLRRESTFDQPSLCTAIRYIARIAALALPNANSDSSAK
jgi:hypothetical protein